MSKAAWLMALLIATCWGALAAPPAKIVLVAGRASHGPGEHEFNAGSLLLAQCLRQNPGVDAIVVKGGWPADDSFFEGASSIVLYMDGGENHPLLAGDRLAKLGKLMKRGVGLACLHYAVEVPGDHGGMELLDWIGGFYRRPYSQNPVNDVELTQTAPAHPISRGWDGFRGTDEWYYRIVFRKDDKRLVPILSAMLPKDAPQQETVRLGSGARRWRPRLRIHWRALSPQLGSGGSAAHGGERDLVDRKGGDSRRRGEVRSHAARPESKPGSKIGPAPRRTSREPRRFSHWRVGPATAWRELGRYA